MCFSFILISIIKKFLRNKITSLIHKNELLICKLLIINVNWRIQDIQTALCHIWPKEHYDFTPFESVIMSAFQHCASQIEVKVQTCSTMLVKYAWVEENL